MRTTLICSGDPEVIDGWRCPHCEQQLALDAQQVRQHAETHACVCCKLEAMVIGAIVIEQRQRRTN